MGTGIGIELTTRAAKLVKCEHVHVTILGSVFGSYIVSHPLGSHITVQGSLVINVLRLKYY